MSRLYKMPTVHPTASYCVLLHQPPRTLLPKHNARSNRAVRAQTAPCQVPDPIKTHVHRWGDDPYASCTWSSWFVNSSPKDTKQFLKGVPGQNVVFAGEHATSAHPGTTHGAWNTGLSAAKAVEHAAAAAEAKLRRKGSGRSDSATESTKTPAQVMEEVADMREKMQAPRPEDVLEVPYMHSPKKHWCRLQRQKDAQEREHAAGAAAAQKENASHVKV